MSREPLRAHPHAPSAPPAAVRRSARTSARRRRLGGAAGLAAGVASMAVALSGCDLLAIDTPLGITSVRVGHTPGQPVTGEVIHPDGTITVTLAALPRAELRGDGLLDTDQDVDAAGVRLCSYEDADHTYSCDTTGLTEGTYVAQVTDAAQPGEGTQSVAVAISPTPGYDPRVGVTEGDPRESYVDGTPGRRTAVPLTGWAPGTSVRVRVRARGGEVAFTTVRRIERTGDATVLVSPLRSGQYRVSVTDGLWSQTIPLYVAQRQAEETRTPQP